MDQEKQELAAKSKSYKKSNELINARGHCTLLCQKLFAIGMSHLHIDERDHVVATVYTSDLKKLLGTSSGSIYTRIEELCEKQEGRSTLFDWQILLKNPEKKELEAHAVVSDAVFRDGTLKIRYNDYLTDMIIDLKENYTVLSLAETVGMKSTHSLRLLEILKSRYDRESYLTHSTGPLSFTYDLIELKMELGIVRIDGNKKIRSELSKDHPDYQLVEEMIEKEGKNKYASFKDFNNRVLAVAKNEINEKTNLSIDYEPVRKGKKAVAVTFYVERINKNEKVKESTKKEKDALLDDIYELLRGQLRISEIIDLCEYAGYDENKLRSACEYYLNYPSEVQNPAAFLKAAVRDGYQTTKEEKKEYFIKVSV